MKKTKIKNNIKSFLSPKVIIFSFLGVISITLLRVSNFLPINIDKKNINDQKVENNSEQKNTVINNINGATGSVAGIDVVKQYYEDDDERTLVIGNSYEFIKNKVVIALVNIDGWKAEINFNLDPNFHTVTVGKFTNFLGPLQSEWVKS